MRAELTSFFEAVLNPSFLDRISHVFMGAWQAGAFLVLSVSAFYLLKNRHQEFAKASIKIALVLAVAASILQLITGHDSALGVAENQPAKLAAYEGHYDASAPAPAYLVGWVNDETREVYGIKIPGLLSWMVHGDASEPVTGLNAFAPEDRPPVNIVFQAYHIMVGVGMALIGISLLSAFYLWRGKLFQTRWLLWILAFSVLGPHITPLLGLLGTVLGMIKAFNVVASEAGLGRADLLAAGISEALITTAAGLVIAIPSLALYNYFRGVLEGRISERMEITLRMFLEDLFERRGER